MAGGAAIVTEAGGVIMDISGESLQNARASPNINFSKAAELLDGTKEAMTRGEAA